MFNEELNNVKKELSSKAANIMFHQPKYAGAAHWARSLKHRIDVPMEVKQDCFCIFSLSFQVCYFFTPF